MILRSHYQIAPLVSKAHLHRNGAARAGAGGCLNPPYPLVPPPLYTKKKNEAGAPMHRL